MNLQPEASLVDADQLLDDVSELVDKIESSSLHPLNVSIPLVGSFERLPAKNFCSFKHQVRSVSKESFYPNRISTALSSDDRGE